MLSSRHSEDCGVSPRTCKVNYLNDFYNSILDIHIADTYVNSIISVIQERIYACVHALEDN